MTASSEFLDQLRQGSLDCHLAGESVLLGVSGGADSIGLLSGWLALSDLGVQVQVAHLNHKLRGSASADDAAWISELCAKRNVPVHIGEEDVLVISREDKLGLEEAARAVRYRFLEGTAVRLKIKHIAVAHTANDQAETILHNLLRGTGLVGLSGMPFKRQLRSGAILCRPMLKITRLSLERFLAEIQQDYRTDYTNQNPDFTRNRLRNQLLPVLARDYNTRVQEALLRLGNQAREIMDDLSLQAQLVLDTAIVNSTPDSVLLLCRELPQRPPLVRECFVELWKRQNWPRQQMTFEQWQQLADLVTVPTGAITLPGQIDARRREGLLVLTAPGNP